MGNNGDRNLGFGNTGSGNIGFGNTGIGNIGFGLTGDHQIGFGGFNSGTGNTGLFNSGVGNTGLFNSGAGNAGFSNSGDLSTGWFNSGTLNSGVGNAGSFNSGWHNVGSYNSGDANTGHVNTGGLNAGDRNTGWLNTGNANTGLANSGDVNTGAFITGDVNNGLFWRADSQGQLSIVFGGEITAIPIVFSADIPLDIPITADIADLTLASFTIPGFPVNTANWPTLVNQQFGVTIVNLAVTNGTLPISDISLSDVTVALPTVTGIVGGPDTTIPIRFTAGVGPTTLAIAVIPQGPGLFNATEAPSSGFFNTGAGGGSGIFSSGAGVSGLWNVGDAALGPIGSALSRWFNQGALGSGLANVGTAVTGSFNTSLLRSAAPAFLSGFANSGSEIAGRFNDPLTLGDYLSRIQARCNAPLPLGIEISLTDTPIDYRFGVEVDVPVVVDGTGIGITTITVGAFTVGPGPLITLNALSGSCNFGRCGSAQLEFGAGLGPLTAGPLQLGFLTTDALSAVLGGPGDGIGLSGTAGLGPIVIPLPWQVFADPSYPITIPAIPWFYDLTGGVDIPITATVGELDINEFANLLPLQLDLLYRYGACSISQFGCTPANVFGPLTFQRPNGTFPTLPANLPLTTAVLVDSTLGNAYGPFSTPAFDIVYPIQQLLSASGSGSLGPFVIERGA